MLTVRPATEHDLDVMVEIMFAELGVEQIAFMPPSRVLVGSCGRHGRQLGVDEFLVAQEGGAVAGFTWLSERGGSLRQGARAAIGAWGILGPLRLAAKGWPRQLVEIPMPPGPKLVELQTHPTRRGTGVGTVLLEHIIELVASRPLSLTTRSDNPAIRLYERHGFVVTAEKSHRAFERRSGAKGRILMVRPASHLAE